MNSLLLVCDDRVIRQGTHRVNEVIGPSSLPKAQLYACGPKSS